MFEIRHSFDEKDFAESFLKCKPYRASYFSFFTFIEFEVKRLEHRGRVFEQGQDCACHFQRNQYLELSDSMHFLCKTSKYADEVVRMLTAYRVVTLLDKHVQWHRTRSRKNSEQSIRVYPGMSESDAGPHTWITEKRLPPRTTNTNCLERR